MSDNNEKIADDISTLGQIAAFVGLPVDCSYILVDLGYPSVIISTANKTVQETLLKTDVVLRLAEELEMDISCDQNVVTIKKAKE